MKFNWRLTLVMLFTLFFWGAVATSLTSCAHMPPIIIGGEYTSPNTHITYKVERQSDGVVTITAQK